MPEPVAPAPAARRLRVRNRPALVVAALGLALAGLLYPTVFDPLFALQPMDRDFAHLLWQAARITAAASVLVGALALLTRSGAAAALLLAWVGLAGTELGFRTWIRHLAPEDYERTHLARLTDEQGQVQGADHADHPFVQYTGMPFSDSVGYNAFGFRGPDWSYDKPAGVVRVALLGASTTEWGLGETLPARVRDALGGGPTVEVLNFGLAGWTSTNSAVNFVLTVQDFAPDLVFVHHGWNDAEMSEGQCPRGDYSSRLSTHPQMLAPGPDTRWLRTSALLRRFVARAGSARGEGCCGNLDHSPFTHLNHTGPPPGRSCGGSIYALKGELWPYERNLRTIVSVARDAGITPVILTMPRTDDRTKDRVTDAGMAQIDAANGVNRRVAAETGARLLDLEAALRGRNELFGDLAHMTPEGNLVKDELLAEVVAEWVRARDG